MRSLCFGALPCLLVVQAAAQTPLTFQDIQARARSAPEAWRTEARLAEQRLQLQESKSFLREGPTVSLSAGPRRSPGLPSSTDRNVEVDLPLFLSPRVRADLEGALGQAHPLLREAARREGAFRLRAAYLDAWLAARTVALLETDLATMHRWVRVAQVRQEAGAEAAFQVALVEGERLKVQQDLDEARTGASQAWGALTALADLPSEPVALAGPGPLPEIPRENLLPRLQESPLRKALLAAADLEARSLRLQEAQALGRWSLRGSYAEEGQDRVTRFGVAVRLSRPGETAALRGRTEAQIRAVQGESRMALAGLDARARGLAARLLQDPGLSALPDFAQAIAAVAMRLEEGRERPSEALPARRQLLEAERAVLRGRHARYLLCAELLALLPEVNP